MYWLTGILGIILAISPFLLSYSDNTAALWTSVIIGGATFIVSLVEASQADREQWEYWTAAILGIIAILSPFIFGFSTNTAALWSTIIIGALIAIFAGSRLFTTNKI